MRRASLTRNFITVFGSVLAALSLLLIIFLLVAQYMAVRFNPYVGVFTYMVLPTLLVIGLLLIPVGVAVTVRKKRTRAAIRAGVAPSPFPSIDLNDATQRHLAFYVSLSTVIIGGTLAAVTYNAFQFMDEPDFCGRLCHSVMRPEWTAHERSSHARVACVSCHIGPGASWFVRSKISGVRQVVAVVTNTYPRPVAVPIENLRPSRDTCEQCHWPERFYGDRQRTSYTYVPDAENTLQKTTQLFRVGSGGGDRGAIHWHTTSVVRYVALDDKRQDIAWVGVEGAGETLTIYEAPEKSKEAAEKRTAGNVRLMDCIDCHNRAAHNFVPYTELVDRAMKSGELDASLPFLKKKSVEAFGQLNQRYTPQDYDAGLKRIKAIEDFYRLEYPDVYREKKERIRSNVEKLEKLYEETVFPEMEIGPSTYTNLLSHTGCFRCHGKLVRSTPNARDRQVIPDRCDFCHYMPTVEVPAKGSRP